MKRLLAMLVVGVGVGVGVFVVVGARLDGPVSQPAVGAANQDGPTSVTTGAPTPPTTVIVGATVSSPTVSSPTVSSPTVSSPTVSTTTVSTTTVSTTTAALQPVEPPPSEPITLLFSGDVIVHVAVADSARTGPGTYDFGPMFGQLAPVIRAADLAICHLETPLDPDSRAPRGFPRFSSPAEIATALADAGFDGCSTASNHVLDRGVSGVAETLDILEGAGLQHTGSARTPQERRGMIYLVGDVKIGHVSYSYGVSGWLRSDQKWVANGLEEDQILADAADLRDRGAEFVVVSLHWGIEYRYPPTSAQVTLGTALMESSLVDLIVGHHAHVLQQVEVVNGKYLLYGLGNFLSNQEPGCCGEVSQEGALMLVRVEPTGAGWSATEVRYVPTWVDRHRNHIILPTISPDVSQHRYAAWLNRSSVRVGESLMLDDGGLSVADACRWMNVECFATVVGAE